MEPDEFFDALLTLVEEHAESLHFFAESLTKRHGEIAADLDKLYKQHGQPYGHDEEAAWRWYAEFAMAHHLQTIANSTVKEHQLLTEAHALTSSKSS